MGLCSSSQNKQDNKYENLDLANLRNMKSEAPMFSRISESLINDIQKLTNIPPIKLHSIILGNKKIKPSSRQQLKTWSKQIPKIKTPEEYNTNTYRQKIKETLCNKTLIALCDASRHLNNISLHNIRVINLGAEIQRHFGCSDIEILHSTINILHDIGFKSPEDQYAALPKYKLYYLDLTYCEEVKWFLDLEIQKRRPIMDLHELCHQMNINKYDKCYKWLHHMFDNENIDDSRDLICIHKKGKEILDRIDILYWDRNRNINKQNNYMDRYEILIIGYLKLISSWNKRNDDIPSIIYIECQRYYHPAIDPHKNIAHLSYLSVVNNSFNLNIYDMKKDELFHVNIKDIDVDITNINKQSILFMVKNASIPLWIMEQYKNKLIDLNINKTDNDLSLLFVKSVEYDNYVMIIDGEYKNGYNFQIPSGTDIVSEMYCYSNTNIVCIDDENEICDYNIHYDEYNKFNIKGETYHGVIPRNSKQETIGCGICTFDNGSKMFKCGGLDINKSRLREEGYIYYNNAEICKLDHNTFSGQYIGDIASMNVGKAYFGTLYINELQRIIAGAGGQEPISSNIVEIYDIIKNKWTVIDIKTNCCYKSVISLKNRIYRQSILWTNIDNPFIINICNGTDYAEFIDIREEKKWIINHKLNNYLKQWNNGTDGQLLI